MSIRPLTPKEMSAAIAGLRSDRWFREQCAAYVARRAENERRAARGLKPLPLVGIESLTPRAPYLIPATVLQRFRPSLAPFGLSVCE